MRLAGSKPIEGLKFTGAVIEHESHITVKPVAFYQFMRAFYLRRS